MALPCYKMPKTFTIICLYMALFNLVIMMPISLCVILPNSYHSGVMSTLVVDSELKFNESLLGIPAELPYEHCFFNLTNGRDLFNSTLTPAPKPTFEEVCVTALIKVQNFDYELNDDRSEASYKTWSTLDMVNIHDWRLEIVTINPNLMALLGAFGSETALAAVQPALYGALQMDTAGLKADGTGAFNDGMFVRRTIREIVKGYTTHITGQPALPAVVPNVYLGYESVDELRAAIQADTALGLMGAPGDGGRHFTKTVKTGKDRPSEIGRLTALKGHKDFSTVPASDALWLFADPGWDVAGDMSSGHETFVLDNLRLMSGQEPLSTSDYPYLATAGMSPIGQMPSFGSSVELLDEVLMRTLTYNCDNDCAGKRIHKALAVQKYSLADTTWQLTSGGVKDELGACAITAAGCDYGMREPHGFVAAAQFHTLPYMGSSSRRGLVSIVPFGGGDELMYESATMGKGASVWFEPFSGALIQTDSNLQQNTIVPKALFDGPLFGSVFSPSSPFDPFFIWPDTRKHVRIEVERAISQDLAGMGPNLLYLLLLIGVIIYVLSGVDNLRQAFGCWQKVKRMRADTVHVEAAPKKPEA
jgi:hypothetical protein